MEKEPLNPLSKDSYWNRVSAGYSHIASWVMEPFSQKAIELLSVKSDDKIIDVACGNGTLSLLLPHKVAQITALDFSEQMVSELKAIVQDQGIQNIKALQADGQNLPFEDESFDAAFSMFGLMFFPDRVQGFKELKRVLKPGKRAAVSSWAPLVKSSLMTTLSEALRAGLPDAPTPRKNSTSLEDQDVFKSEMEKAGFKDVCIHEITCVMKPQPPEAFWEIMSNGGPLVMFKQEADEQKWKEISQKAISYLERSLGKSGTETYTTAYIGVGEK